MRVGVLVSHIRPEEKLLISAFQARGIEPDILLDREIVFDLTVGLEQLDLVDPAALFMFELHFQHLARVIALQPRQHRLQRQRIAGLHGRARPIVVVAGACRRTGQRQHQHGGKQWQSAGRVHAAILAARP